MRVGVDRVEGPVDGWMVVEGWYATLDEAMAVARIVNAKLAETDDEWSDEA